MSEERPTTRQGFLSRMFSGNADEEGTAVYSAEEVGAEETGRDTMEPRSFTVERAADIIRNLPPEVPRPAAVRIVRGTLEAAGIDIAELTTSTRARESKLNSEIELSQTRIQELKDKTEEVIRSYEGEIRKAREARDFGISDEERRISEARSGLEDVERVRDFFGVSEDDYSTTGDLAAEEETQVMERPDEEDTEILRRPGPLSEDYWNTGENRDR
jgi:ribosome-binding protein aMBF1 (putative translation factor)